MHTLKLTIKTNNPKTTYKAIKPELKDAPNNRTKTQITKQNNKLQLQIQAKDTTSLRAATNSWLRWIMITTETNQITQQNHQQKT
ncbi:Pcc1 subunit of KEOPS complex [Methanonatronarchaeum thermophilum]|uniref:Pcc1 subunit of KEOPS complex n=1 Tax=Methanonatronarchaeum thermophilum TaxID=1927129 RepID=A0A1Y3GDP2_9EURY|nr:KEOPS complex subunit Pcc1 [Methanonatronarchaeum thermophilum]OUJ19529.1 Pcc1 subunit of KEOPS complex [Methanonatronarchaeum thermophilum]